MSDLKLSLYKGKEKTVDSPEKVKQETYDAHVIKASKIFGIPSAEVTEAQRKEGKKANYLEAYNFPRKLKDLL